TSRSAPRFSRSSCSARSRSFQRSGSEDWCSSSAIRSRSCARSKTPPELVPAFAQARKALGQLVIGGGLRLHLGHGRGAFLIRSSRAPHRGVSVGGGMGGANRRDPAPIQLHLDVGRDVALGNRRLVRSRCSVWK